MIHLEARLVHGSMGQWGLVVSRPRSVCPLREENKQKMANKHLEWWIALISYKLPCERRREVFVYSNHDKDGNEDVLCENALCVDTAEVCSALPWNNICVAYTASRLGVWNANTKISLLKIEHPNTWQGPKVGQNCGGGADHCIYPLSRAESAPILEGTSHHARIGGTTSWILTTV